MNKGEFISKNNNKNEEDFDLRIIWNVFLRNKKSIIFVSFISGILSVIYSFNVKPVWIGGFEVLVRQGNNNSNQMLRRGNELNDLLKGKDFYDSKTQAIILKSPSVLFPVYEFVQNEYLKRGIQRDEISYSSWFNSYLDIKFTEGSKVLSVKYKDNDKDLILKALEQISKKYQEYSKKDRLKSISKTINYLNKQKKEMEIRSNESLKSLNKHSLENGLGNLDGFSGIDNGDNKNKLDTSELNKRYQGQIASLEFYESRYLDLSSNLNENSQLLQGLKKKINNIKESLKRPGQILIEYRNLKRIANRDLTLLENIDNSLEVSKLEQARLPDSWEIISVPTIEDNKFFPNKKLFLLAGLTISFFASITGCIVKEKLTGYVYTKSIINKLIKTNLIESLNLKNNQLNNKFVANIFSKYEGNNRVINFSSTRFTKEDIFLDSKNFIFEDESLKIADNILIIIEDGKAKYDDFLLLNKYILLNEEKIIGWIFIEK